MPESNVSNNGELFRALAQWLDKRFAKQKEVASSRKFNRAANIYMNNEESGLDQLKYYASQLFTGGRMGTIKLLEYITKLANVGLIDNAILRKLEEVYKDEKASYNMVLSVILSDNCFNWDNDLGWGENQ